MDAIEISGMVKAYVAGRNEQPFQAPSSPRSWTARPIRPASRRLARRRPARNLTTSTDLARFIQGRLDLLLNNALWALRWSSSPSS